MSILKTTAALAAGLLIASAVPAVVYAQGESQGTTLGGSAKDNSASGGSEASGTSKAGTAMMSKKHHSGKMMKKSGAMSGSAGK